MRTLAGLAVFAALAGGARPTGRVATDGIALSLPSGWHARAGRGVIEAATRPLPPLGPWVAASLSKALGPDDVSVILYEDAATSPPPSIYRAGAPRPFTRGDFGPPPSGGSNPGDHRFARRNFRVAGRFFDLFVEAGSRQPTAAGLAKLNEVVRSLRVEPGDFYPGTAAPARFAAAPGWHVRTSPRVALAPETWSVAIAATVPYRDELDAFPPNATLARLPADGVIVVLDLLASNRDPPLARGPVPSALPEEHMRCGAFEGVPGRFAVCPVHAVRRGEYTIDGWVVYGRARPTAAQRAAARAELARLELPAWPRWR
jgi:hypothetical protein